MVQYKINPNIFVQYIYLFYIINNKLSCDHDDLENFFNFKSIIKHFNKVKTTKININIQQQTNLLHQLLFVLTVTRLSPLCFNNSQRISAAVPNLIVHICSIILVRKTNVYLNKFDSKKSKKLRQSSPRLNIKRSIKQTW